MSVQAIVINTSGSSASGNVSRVLLVSQAVTGPAGAAGDGATDLGYTAAPTAGTVTSSTGASATVPLADGTNAGLMAPAQHTKLAGIESGATADQSAAEILAALLTVDGAGSGLDADLLDGNSSAAFATAAQGSLADSAVQPARSISTTAPLGGGGDLSANRTLTVSAATTDATGVVELATTTEATTGTDTARAVTPAGVQAVRDLLVAKATFPESIAIACSDMTTAITTGTTKAYWVAPWACTLVGVKATLATAASGSGITVDINEGAGAGTSVLSTKLTIDVSETDSADATTPAVISDSSIAANGRITIDVDAVGTGAAGLIVYLSVTRAL